MAIIQPKFCSNCGGAIDAHLPQTCVCQKCGHRTRLIVATVAIALVPVMLLPDPSLIIIRRNLADGYGKWALPGGYHQVGRTIKETAATEFTEETSIYINADNMTYFDKRVEPDGDKNLAFFLHPPITLQQYRTQQRQASEVQEVSLVPNIHTLDRLDIAYTLHYDMMCLYFELTG